MKLEERATRKTHLYRHDTSKKEKKGSLKVLMDETHFCIPK